MFTLGVDFGTNSVRALVVRCSDGAEYGSWRGRLSFGRAGRSARSERRPAGAPASGRLSLRPGGKHQGRARRSWRAKPDFDPSKVVGIGVDSTGSSPIPVDAKNRPLASSAAWKDDLNAQCWLWKDHTSWREAAQITELCAKIRPQYIAKCGGVYSSEWFWAKIWHCLNVAPETFDAAFSWVELADWIPSVLAGVADPRWSSAAFAPPATRRSTPTNGAACPTRSSSERSTRASPSFATGFTKRPTTPPSRPARFAPNGRRSSGSPRAFRSRSASSTFTTARSAAACARARSSR